MAGFRTNDQYAIFKANNIVQEIGDDEIDISKWL